MGLQQDLDTAIANVLARLAELRLFPLYSDVIPQPGPPARPQEIAALERRVGQQLPPSYRRFLEMHDGYRWLAYPGHMLSLRDLSPGGSQALYIEEWKRETAEAGCPEVVDGLVIAYLEQPNNWAYLDPNHVLDTGEWELVLYVPGADPDVFPDLPAFLNQCARNAEQSERWAADREKKKAH